MGLNCNIIIGPKPNDYFPFEDMDAGKPLNNFVDHSGRLSEHIEAV